MKPIWNGAIGFGLVNIPVKLYSATESSTLDLDMLDKKDLTIQDFTIRNALDRIAKKGDIFLLLRHCS
jgi:non-homologous end joining protein Ku